LVDISSEQKEHSRRNHSLWSAQTCKCVIALWLGSEAGRQTTSGRRLEWLDCCSWYVL